MWMRIQEQILMRMRIQIRLNWRAKYLYKKFFKWQSGEMLVPFLTDMNA
jgi:hypothetical protein